MISLHNMTSFLEQICFVMSEWTIQSYFCLKCMFVRSSCGMSVSIIDRWVPSNLCVNHTWIYTVLVLSYEATTAGWTRGSGRIGLIQRWRYDGTRGADRIHPLRKQVFTGVKLDWQWRALKAHVQLCSQPEAKLLHIREGVFHCSNLIPWLCYWFDELRTASMSGIITAVACNTYENCQHKNLPLWVSKMKYSQYPRFAAIRLNRKAQGRSHSLGFDLM